MSTTTIEDDPMLRARQIVDNLPAPNYPVNFQPSYPDREAHVAAVHELTTMSGITTPEHIRSFRAQLAAARMIVIFGSCHEAIRLDIPISELAAPVLDGLDLLGQSNLNDFLAIYRGLAQSVKPRSSELQTLPSGLQVPSFQGEAINGPGVDDRTPDPSRLVASAIQSRDIREHLRELSGEHMPTAHEMLSLSFDFPFVKTDRNSGKHFMLSADLPWLGVRTNHPDGIHAQLLSTVENPKGVKLGTSTTEAHIAKLTNMLNPRREPGRLIFMPRVSLDDGASLQRIVKAIRRHSENAVVMFDMHGITWQLDDGTKIRSVPDIMAGATMLAEAAAAEGLRLGGGHYETINDNSRLECVDHADQRPTHEGSIDPGLNPRQLLAVVNHLATLQ